MFIHLKIETIIYLFMKSTEKEKREGKFLFSFLFPESMYVLFLDLIMICLISLIFFSINKIICKCGLDQTISIQCLLIDQLKQSEIKH